MPRTLMTIMATTIAVGGLTAGVAGASSPPPATTTAAVAAASAEEQQLHAAIGGLTAMERQLQRTLAEQRASFGVPTSTLPSAPGEPATTTVPRGTVSQTTHPVVGQAPVSASRNQSEGSGERQESTGGWSGPTTSAPSAPTTVAAPVTTTQPPPPSTTTTQPPTPSTTTTQPWSDGGSDD